MGYQNAKWGYLRSLQYLYTIHSLTLTLMSTGLIVINTNYTQFSIHCTNVGSVSMGFIGVNIAGSNTGYFLSFFIKHDLKR